MGGKCFKAKSWVRKCQSIFLLLYDNIVKLLKSESMLFICKVVLHFISMIDGKKVSLLLNDEDYFYKN